MSGSRVDVGGVLTADTTWDADVIRVTSSVTVPEDFSLSIAPGTRVQFDGFYRLLVHGRLWAIGRPNHRIHFEASDDQQAEGWDGIDFLNIPAANDSSRLEFCVISGAVARPAQRSVRDRTVGGTHRAETGAAVSIVNVNKLAIASCIFIGNEAEYGGAVYCGYGASPVLAGNLFTKNSAAQNGSVLLNVYAFPKLINNTIVDNDCLAENSFHLGTAVENFNGKIVLQNNIIRDNLTPHYSGAQVVELRECYTHANNIQGYVGHDSNLDVDPGFLGAGLYPYQLTEGSLCVDTGLDDKLTGVLAAYDVAGQPRVCDGLLDRGAYEFCGVSTSVDPGPQVHNPLDLSCHPNPFNPCTRMCFNLAGDEVVELAVYDLQGRRLRTLLVGTKSAGRHEITWDGRDEQGRGLASGTYLYQLRAGDQSVTRTLTLVR